MAELRDKLINEVKDKPLQIGDRVVLKRKEFRSVTTGRGKTKKTIQEEYIGSYSWAEVIALNPLTIDVNEGCKDHFKINDKDENFISAERDLTWIGVNPFQEDRYNSSLLERIHTVGSLAYKLEIDYNEYSKRMFGNYSSENGVEPSELNFEPFVEIKGQREFYQRPKVWSTSDKQRFIESYLLRRSGGEILVRKRPFDWVMAKCRAGIQVGFYDIVDGKQRLSTLAEFMRDEFPTIEGWYYSDFDSIGKRKFSTISHNVLSWKQIPEQATDKEVLELFLLVNVAGIPQTTEHIDYVKSILEKF